MAKLDSPAPDQWKAYAGIGGLTEYVSLRDVVGLKFPDEVTNGIVLRLSNGQFVSLNTSVSVATVLGDLNAL